MKLKIITMSTIKLCDLTACCAEGFGFKLWLQNPRIWLLSAETKQPVWHMQLMLESALYSVFSAETSKNPGHYWMSRVCARLPALSSHHYIRLWQLVIKADEASNQWCGSNTIHTMRPYWFSFPCKQIWGSIFLLRKPDLTLILIAVFGWQIFFVWMAHVTLYLTHSHFFLCCEFFSFLLTICAWTWYAGAESQLWSSFVSKKSEKTSPVPRAAGISFRR